MHPRALHKAHLSQLRYNLAACSSPPPPSFLSPLSSCACSVPQDDIMMRDLTVEENIMFAAMTRLPSSWSSDRKLAFGDYVIELLGLSEIRNSPIGDEATRGISGGQRKRVNIGIELAADPVILALDEPTSGLGASVAAAVCDVVMVARLLLPVCSPLVITRFVLFVSPAFRLQTPRAAQPCALPCAASQTRASP